MIRNSGGADVRASVLKNALIICVIATFLVRCSPKTSAAIPSATFSHLATRLYDLTDGKIVEYDPRFRRVLREVACEASSCSTGAISGNGILFTGGLSVLHIYRLVDLSLAKTIRTPGMVDGVFADKFGNAYVYMHGLGIAVVGTDHRLHLKIRTTETVSTVATAPSGLVAVALPRRILIFRRGLSSIVKTIWLRSMQTDAAFDQQGVLYVISMPNELLSYSKRHVTITHVILRDYASIIVGTGGAIYVFDGNCKNARVIKVSQAPRMRVEEVVPLRQMRSATVDGNGTIYTAQGSCDYFGRSGVFFINRDTGWKMVELPDLYPGTLLLAKVAESS